MCSFHCFYLHKKELIPLPLKKIPKTYPNQTTPPVQRVSSILESESLPPEDLDKDRDLFWIARAGLKAPLLGHLPVTLRGASNWSRGD